MYIKSIYINGFKKFMKLELNLNKGRNIVVGENEKGKSTILEAIDMVVNQKYKNTDKYIVQELLNSCQKKNFENDPSIENLPKIYIEMELELDNSNVDSKKYYGPDNLEHKDKYGLKFTCEIDSDYIDDLTSYINEGKIPYEYYKMEWGTFAGSNYRLHKKAYNSILIDSSSIDSNSSFNYYNKSLFYSIHSMEERLKLKNKFREKMIRVFDDIGINDVIQNENKFGVNHKKIIFENILSIYDGDIPLENKGKGMENIIKTKMALEKEETKIDTVLIEEPENHLSHSNLLKMIEDISARSDKSQLIITTHENMIASRLNLKNIIWLSESNEAIKLDNINEETADFFMRADDNKFLQFLLSDKIILVEGATEYLLIPELFKNKFETSLEEENITIISCGGISYKRYLEIAETLEKKVCVITDNDGNQKSIDKINNYNEEQELQKIFTDKNIENFTWEVCIYKSNEDKLKEIIDVQDGSKYSFNGKDYGCIGFPHLGKMLNKKVDIAYQMLKENYKWEVPSYVKEALEWIK